ncbi:unnamed protein product [Durusdinium trenchii]|uniref:Uncharacterized protein n=1 Tax=Durusdinium trenchii TaxID=1381693 RepID=A0ABP0RTG9_9DINO
MARPFGGGGWLFALWPLTVTAHVGETLATSPCARLRQQLGDDVLHSLLSLDLPSFDLPSLSVSLLGLLSKELTEEFLHLAEVSQDLLRSSCTGAPSPPSLSAVAGPLITRVADLERLEQSQSLAEGLGDFSGIEELFHQAMAHPRLPEESTEVFHLLLRGSELLSQQLAQLKDALQASLQRALVLEPGPELRAQLRRLLPQWALHRLGPGVPSTPVRRPHALCREDLGHLSSTAESFRDAAGRSPPGTRSARAWLRRVERAGGRLARQVVSAACATF